MAGLQTGRQGIADGLEGGAVIARDHQLGKRCRGEPADGKPSLPRTAADRADRPHPLRQRGRQLVRNRDAAADDGQKPAQPLRVSAGSLQVLLNVMGHLLSLG
jgi:hypothetical protein